MSRVCLKSNLKGDMIYRLYSVTDTSNDSWWEIEVSHRTLFEVPKMRIAGKQAAEIIYEELTE